MVDQLERLKRSLEGRYVVERELGRGGMATVYLAYDPKLRRRVAIKVLHGEVASAVGVERFEREIRIAAGLTHPRILPVHESGEADGLLYYVMPYVEGESLRARLDREKQLPLADALQIARQVARALEHAHGRGVVHRDIKPANVLLTSGGAVVTDFGIARAISQVEWESLTITGLTVGTPGYMSPEQATGQEEIDGRSDLYSLGCVLYEMLVGEPPFTGRSPQVILARQMAADPSPISTVRPTLPGATDGVLHRLLARVPADRFQSAGAVIDALGRLEAAEARSADRQSGGLEREPSARRRLGPRRLAWAGLALAVVGAGVVWSVSRAAGPGADSDLAVDTAHYVILPFEYETGLEPRLNETQFLHDALTRWRGISIADPFQVRHALESSEADAPGDRARLARRLGAGRFLGGSVSRIGDSLRVRAAVYDATSGGRPLSDHAIRVPLDLSGADSLFARLADRLLFPGSVPDDVPGPRATRSVPARRAFTRGQQAIEAWDLDRADSAFSRAAALDPDYAEAHLWTALVRAWRGADRARWRFPAEQAALREDQLSDRDRLIARAVLAQARGEAGDACPLWDRVTATAPRDFAAWQGLAHCLKSDSAVVRDPGSPSGWSFRTSYDRALRAYERAFELLPSILASFQRRSYEPLRELFMIAGNERRAGSAHEDSIRLRAEPAWRGDSLAFVPYPRQPGESLLEPLAPTLQKEAAIRHLRERFRDVALAWLGSNPRDADALHAVAIALGLLGDASALDTLRRARTLAADPAKRISFAGTEVWMSLGLALPDRGAELGRIRSLADSLLGLLSSERTDNPLLGAALAALTGRADLAAAYMRQTRAGEALGVPPPLRRDAPAFLVLSALGGPPPLLDRLEAGVREAIREGLLPGQRHQARMEWLARPVSLAFPSHRLASLSELAGQGDYLVDLQAAWVAGDRARVRRGLDEIREVRTQFLPWRLTIDALYPEVALLLEMGRPEEAAAWVDPTLRALPQVAPSALGAPEKVAALVRTAGLRAKIAQRLGDPASSRTWARAVLVLWSDADPFLEPYLAELRSFADHAR